MSPNSLNVWLNQLIILCMMHLMRLSVIMMKLLVSNPPYHDEFISELQHIIPYHDHALNYISGYIQTKLIHRVKCPECVEFILASSSSEDAVSQFTHLRDNGGLTHAHPDVSMVVKTSDQILRRIDLVCYLTLPIEAMHPPLPVSP